MLWDIETTAGDEVTSDKTCCSHTLKTQGQQVGKITKKASVMWTMDTPLLSYK